MNADSFADESPIVTLHWCCMQKPWKPRQGCGNGATKGAQSTPHPTPVRPLHQTTLYWLKRSSHLQPKQFPVFLELDCESLAVQSCEILAILPTERPVPTKILRIAPLVRRERAEALFLPG
jgi:hypothetical protein